MTDLAIKKALESLNEPKLPFKDPEFSCIKWMDDPLSDTYLDQTDDSDEVPCKKNDFHEYVKEQRELATSMKNVITLDEIDKLCENDESDDLTSIDEELACDYLSIVGSGRAESLGHGYKADYCGKMRYIPYRLAMLHKEYSSLQDHRLYYALNI